MNSAKKMLFGYVGLAAIVLFFGWNNTVAEDNLECWPGGIWNIEVLGEKWSFLHVPLEHSKNLFGSTSIAVNSDPTFGGMLPDATAISPGLQLNERVDTNLYNFTHVCYGVTADNRLVYIRQASGTWSFLDCDTLEANGRVAYYAPWQDPYGEEPPEYGCYIMATCIGVRAPIVPPCEF